jgi:hypothetical protein
MHEYMKVPWQRAATYVGVISGVFFVCLLLLAPHKATEPSPEKISQPSAAESSAPSESSAPKEVPSTDAGGKSLVVKSWSCTMDSDWVFIRGELKNVSTTSITRLQVVATLRTADGTLISSGESIPEYETILPGQTSPFEVSVGFNPAVRSADLSLKNFNNGEAVEFSGQHSESCAGTGPES